MMNHVEVGPESPVQSGGAHRALVLALGDALALRQLGTGQWLSDPEWVLALERVRSARYGHLPRERGFLQVGADLAARYLASGDGLVLAGTLSAMTADRLVAALLPLLVMRMGKEALVDGDPTVPSLRIHGHRVTPDDVTLGGVSTVAQRLLVPCTVSVRRADEQLLELRFVEDGVRAEAPGGKSQGAGPLG